VLLGLRRRVAGAIDHPRSGCTLSEAELYVSGWAHDPKQPVRQVEVRLGDRSLGLAALGIHRPDVSSALQDREAARTGFELAVDLAGDRPLGSTRVAVEVTLANGRRKRLGSVPIEVAAVVSDRLPITRAVTLDRTASGIRIAHRWLTATGWAVDRGELRVARVEVWLDGHFLGHAGLGRPRPDLSEHTNQPGMVLSGFEFESELPEGLFGGALQAVVCWNDGRREASSPVPVSFDTETPSAPSVESPSPQRAVRSGREPDRPIRLAIAARSLGRGGSQLRMVEVVEWLASAGGFEITVLHDREGPLEPRLAAAGAALEPTVAIALDDLARYRRGVAALARRLDGRFDLLLAFTVTGFPFVEAAVSRGIPSVLRVGEAAPLRQVSRWLYGSLDKTVEQRARQALADADLVISISRAALETYAADGYRLRSAFLPHGVSLCARTTIAQRVAARERLGLDRDQLLLVCAGMLWPVKGQAVLARALAPAREAHPELSCVLVGDDNPGYAASIRTYAEVSKLNGHLTMPGFRSDMTDWWRAADAVVCSSETEALPAAVLEGMATGLPVISTQVGDLPRLIEPGVSGWLCDARDAEALRLVLEEVAETPDAERRLLGERARRTVAAYERSAMLERLVGVLRTVANHGPLPAWTAADST
jgi:glycosyltransferase involved in cell wall biosynthesis